MTDKQKPLSERVRDGEFDNYFTGKLWRRNLLPEISAMEHYIYNLEAENKTLRTDADRLMHLMNESGQFYVDGLRYQMTGALRQYIDNSMRAKYQEETG